MFWDGGCVRSDDNQVSYLSKFVASSLSRRVIWKCIGWMDTWTVACQSTNSSLSGYLTRSIFLIFLSTATDRYRSSFTYVCLVRDWHVKWLPCKLEDNNQFLFCSLHCPGRKTTHLEIFTRRVNAAYPSIHPSHPYSNSRFPSAFTVKIIRSIKNFHHRGFSTVNGG